MGSYIFKPYNLIFPQLFENEYKRLRTFLKKDYPIEHVGSTAVPNLGGKGIIDICIVVPEKDRENVWEVLKNAGYTLRPNFTPESMHVSHTIYLPDPVEGNRKYHIHIHDFSSKWLKEALLFRDYLRKHPEEVEQYSNIKKKAAEEANDNRETYLAIKGPIIDEILNKALRELESK